MLGIEATTYPSGFSNCLLSSNTFQGLRRCSKTSPNTATSNDCVGRISVTDTKSKSATITFSQYCSAIFAASGLISTPMTVQPFLFSNLEK